LKATKRTEGINRQIKVTTNNIGQATRKHELEIKKRYGPKYALLRNTIVIKIIIVTVIINNNYYYYYFDIKTLTTVLYANHNGVLVTITCVAQCLKRQL